MNYLRFPVSKSDSFCAVIVMLMRECCNQLTKSQQASQHPRPHRICTSCFHETASVGCTICPPVRSRLHHGGWRRREGYWCDKQLSIPAQLELADSLDRRSIAGCGVLDEIRQG